MYRNMFKLCVNIQIKISQSLQNSSRWFQDWINNYLIQRNPVLCSVCPVTQHTPLSHSLYCTCFTLRAYCTLHNKPYCTVCIVTCNANCKLHTIHNTLHFSHCTLYTAHCLMNTSHSTLNTADITLHTAHSTLHTAHCTLHTAHCT